MNAARRKELEWLLSVVSEACNKADELATEEQEALDALPENLQQGEQAELMRTAVEALESARDSLEDVGKSLEEIAQTRPSSHDSHK